MAQDFRNMSPVSQQAPATSWTLAVTGPLTRPSRGIYVGVAGTVAWTDLEGHAVTGIALQAGGPIAIALASIESLGAATLYVMQ